jgi:hypothetical protein
VLSMLQYLSMYLSPYSIVYILFHRRDRLFFLEPTR